MISWLRSNSPYNSKYFPPYFFSHFITSELFQKYRGLVLVLLPFFPILPELSLALDWKDNRWNAYNYDFYNQYLKIWKCQIKILQIQQSYLYSNATVIYVCENNNWNFLRCVSVKKLKQSLWNWRPIIYGVNQWNFSSQWMLH